MANYARSRLSDAVTRGLYYSGAFAASRQLLRKTSAVILRYHSVCEHARSPLSYIDPGLSVPLEAFDRQMKFLRERYAPVSLEDVVEAVGGGRPLSNLAVAVTFDDGYRDNHQYAFPVLRKYGIAGTFYITAGCVNMGEPLWTSRLRYYFTATQQPSLALSQPQPKQLDLASPAARNASFAYTIATIKSAGKVRGGEIFRDVETKLAVTDLAPLKNSMMTWGEIEEMGAGGQIIGAHTLTHPNLPGLPHDEADAEIAGSKSLIEEKIKAPVLHFAYTNGRGVSHFNEPVREMVKKAGFLSSVTSIDGPVYRDDDLFTLQRLGVYRKHANLSRFALDIERTRLAGPKA
jgi:peptidoglycan/xylan/chitin deacetylase (PgdA/CDA1 family)